MNTLNPMLADGINLPLVLVFGVGVLIPLLAFEVGVEGALVSRCWRIPFRELARCVFLANCWSLLAGIPVKLFNAWLYSRLLPVDLAGFFSHYPSAVMLGTLVYFLVTWLVETRYAMSWLAREGRPVPRSRVWLGLLFANLASYAVLAPLHYYATRPIHNLHEFTANTAWASQPPTQILYLDPTTLHLKSIFSDGSKPETIVPLPMLDYQISADLNLCMLRAPDGNLHLYRRDTASDQLVWITTERYLMENVAFSPSGRFVAWFKSSMQMVEVTDWQQSKHWYVGLAGDNTNLRIAWSTEDSVFVITSRERQAWMRVSPGEGLRELSPPPDPAPALNPVYGRVGGGAWYSGQEWGRSYHSDERNGLRAWTEPGLGAHLRVYRTNNPGATLVRLAINPGLLHLARYGFSFTHPAFLAVGRECLFETPTDLYLLDIERKRIGRVTPGHTFILLEERYTK